MKVLFLDIDGVVNSNETLTRGDAHGGILGIDKYLAFIVGRLCMNVPDLNVVLSSSWRHFAKGREQVEAQVVPIYDVTGTEPYDADGEPHTQRGREIKKWLDAHPEVTRYAIVDDGDDMLDEQRSNFFRTSWEHGITPEIATAIYNHLTV